MKIPNSLPTGQAGKFQILNSKEQKGLTLIELLVTISIILIISLVAFLNHLNIGKTVVLQRAAHKVAQDLRRTQEAAMSAKCSPCQIIFNISQKNSYQIVEETTYIVNLEEGVEIVDLSPVGLLIISFYPPNPQIEISGNGTEAVITLSNGISSKTVKINKAGRIEME